MSNRKNRHRPKAYQDPDKKNLPVRKIKPTACSVTGKIFSNKCNRFICYESHLEKRFALHLEFDPAVRWFLEQPVTIHYVDKDGIKRSYTPDYRVVYDPEVVDAPDDLVEIKHSLDLVKNRDLLAPKFAAAKAYAAALGMGFKVVTEYGLSIQAHHAAMTLRALVRCGSLREFEDVVLRAIGRFGETTPELLLKALGTGVGETPLVLRSIWSLVARGKVRADLASGLHLHTRIWVLSQEEINHV